MTNLAYDLTPFVGWLRSWGAADTTVINRFQILTAGIRSWGDPETVTAAALGAWLASPTYAPWTRVAYYGHLRSLFGWLTSTGRRADDPTLHLRRPRTPKNRPRPLSAAEVRLVRATASGNLATWFELGVLAGLRAHEIAKLRGEDVQEDAIYVIGKGRQAAFVPTHERLWEIAQGYPARGFWFPSTASVSGHVGPKSISTLTTRLFVELGIEGSSHRARHSYATDLLRGGTNIRVVQELMRHGSLATTAKYTAVHEDELRAAINSLAA